MTKEEKQFDILKTELEISQQQMNKYDQLSGTIKTWTVTLWVASLGWSFQIKRKELVLLSIFTVLVFWTLDAINKNFRENYKKRRQELAGAIREFLNNPSSADNFTFLDFPLRNWIGVIRQFAEPHVSLLYLSLIVITVIIFLKF